MNTKTLQVVFNIHVNFLQNNLGIDPRKFWTYHNTGILIAETLLKPTEIVGHTTHALIYRMTEHGLGQRFRADAFEAMMKVELCHLRKFLLRSKKPIVSVKHVDILVMPIYEKVFEGLA